MGIVRTIVRAAVVHPDRVELRAVSNDSGGFRVSLGGFRTGIRYVPLTFGGDLLLANGGASALQLPYNTLASMVVDRFRPGWSACERVAGTAVIVTHRDGVVGDVNGQLAQLVVNAAKRLGLHVSEPSSNRLGPTPAIGGAVVPGLVNHAGDR